MAEFFITRATRRLGIGATAVRLIFSRFAGRWEITEYLRNATAVSFWRRVVASYTSGNYLERVVNGEVRQTFESELLPSAPSLTAPYMRPVAGLASISWRACSFFCGKRSRG